MIMIFSKNGNEWTDPFMNILAKAIPIMIERGSMSDVFPWISYFLLEYEAGNPEYRRPLQLTISYTREQSGETVSVAYLNEEITIKN